MSIYPWPEHEQHRVIVSERGREDFLLEGFARVISVIDGLTYVDYEPKYNDREKSLNFELSDTEYWCETCGTPLPDPSSVELP